MIKNIKGTKDLLPQDVLDILEIEKHLNIFMSIHGYGEIRTPIFESTELFSRNSISLRRSSIFLAKSLTLPCMITFSASI